MRKQLQNFGRYEQVVTSRIRSLLVTAAVLFGICLFDFSPAFAGDQMTEQKRDQLEAELRSMVNGTNRLPYDALKKAGWKFPEFGSMSQPWPHDYEVLRKDNVYGIIVTQGKKTGKFNAVGQPYYSYRGGANSAYVIAGIPAGYLPVVGCNKVATTEEERFRQRCGNTAANALKAANQIVPNATAVTCGMSSTEEMVAFVKMPSKCAQESTLLHSAYRYSDESPLQLESIPIQGLSCVVEDYRAKQCPVLMQ